MLPEFFLHSSVSRLLALMSRLICFQPIFITDNDVHGCPEQQAVINNMFKASANEVPLCSGCHTRADTHSQGKLLLMRCALMPRRRKSSGGWKQRESGGGEGMSTSVASQGHSATTCLHSSFQACCSADSTSVSALSFHLSIHGSGAALEEKTGEFGESLSPFCAFRH